MGDQAMKLFEALSGVDEELLERCNQEVNRKNTTVYRLFGKYGRTMAACVCLLVVGAAAWSGYRFAAGSYGSDASGWNGSPAELHDMEQPVLTDGGSNGESGGAGLEDRAAGSDTAAAGGTAGGGEELGYGADESHTGAVSSAVSVETATPEAKQELAESEQAMAADKMSDMSSSGNDFDSQISDSRGAVSWEEAIVMEPFAGYLPTILPPGYEPFSARRSSFPDLWNNMIFKWSEGEHILSLDMTSGEVKSREDIEQSDGINEYLAGEFGKELIPEPLDGQIRFTLYYGDGMKIEFAGYITVDEMWEVVESVSE